MHLIELTTVTDISAIHLVFTYGFGIPFIVTFLYQNSKLVIFKCMNIVILKFILKITIGKYDISLELQISLDLSFVNMFIRSKIMYTNVHCTAKLIRHFTCNWFNFATTACDCSWDFSLLFSYWSSVWSSNSVHLSWDITRSVLPTQPWPNASWY